MNPNRSAQDYKKLLIIFLIALGVLIAIFLAINLTSRVGKIKTDLLVAPPEAEVIVDGQRTDNTTLYLKPGEHTFSVSYPGFEELNTTTNITKSDRLVFVLTPLTTQARNLTLEYSDLYLEAEALAGEEAQREGQSFRDKNPITNILPYRGALFDIDYRTDINNPSRLIVQISANSAEDRSYAIKYIDSLGYNLVDYEVEFMNLPKIELE